MDVRQSSLIPAEGIINPIALQPKLGLELGQSTSSQQKVVSIASPSLSLLKSLPAQNSLSSLPYVVYQNLFYFLNLRSCIEIASTCKIFNLVFKRPKIAFQLESIEDISSIPPKILLKMIKIADKHLKELNFIKAEIPPQEFQTILTACVNVRTLNLSSCNCTLPTKQFLSLINQFLRDLPRELQGLDLSNWRKLPEINLTHLLPKLTKLKSLNLSGCLQLKGNCFTQLTTNIEELYLNECTKLSEGYLEELFKKSPRLHTLHLERCKDLWGISFEHLTTNVRKLNLKGCTGLSETILINIFKKLIHLDSLDLTSCTQLVGECLKSLTKNVITLNLSFCKILINSTFKKTIQSLSNLHSLNLNHCNLTDDSLLYLTTNLRVLHLGSSQKFSKEGFIQLLQRLTRLNYLDLSLCSLINDDFLIHIPRNLKTLNLLCCEVSKEALTNLTQRLPHLRILGQNKKISSISK